MARVEIAKWQPPKNLTSSLMQKDMFEVGEQFWGYFPPPKIKKKSHQNKDPCIFSFRDPQGEPLLPTAILGGVLHSQQNSDLPQKPWMHAIVANEGLGWDSLS